MPPTNLHLDVPEEAWWALNGFVVALLLLDLLVFNRRSHTIGLREAARLSAFFVSAALAVEPLRIKSEFKKGGAVCVRFEKTIGPGGATLVWMLPPRVLRAMR